MALHGLVYCRTGPGGGEHYAHAAVAVAATAKTAQVQHRGGLGGGAGWRRRRSRAGVQNSCKCLAAEILCLAKCVSRDISPTCVKVRKSQHFANMRQSA